MHSQVLPVPNRSLADLTAKRDLRVFLVIRVVNPIGFNIAIRVFFLDMAVGFEFEDVTATADFAAKRLLA